MNAWMEWSDAWESWLNAWMGWMSGWMNGFMPKLNDWIKRNEWIHACCGTDETVEWGNCVNVHMHERINEWMDEWLDKLASWKLISEWKCMIAWSGINEVKGNDMKQNQVNEWMHKWNESRIGWVIWLMGGWIGNAMKWYETEWHEMELVTKCSGCRKWKMNDMSDMDEVDGWIKQSMNGCMYEWVNEWMITIHEWINKWNIIVRMSIVYKKSINECHSCMDEWMDWLNRCMEWKNKEWNECMTEWMHEWMKWMNEWVHESSNELIEMNWNEWVNEWMNYWMKCMKEWNAWHGWKKEMNEWMKWMKRRSEWMNAWIKWMNVWLNE